MKKLQIKTLSGVWHYVFCRSLNSTDPETGSAIIHTTLRSKALDARGDNLEYITRHANGREVRTEPAPFTGRHGHPA